jgi:hypothetical protein
VLKKILGRRGKKYQETGEIYMMMSFKLVLLTQYNQRDQSKKKHVVLMGKPEGKNRLGRPRHRSVDDTKWSLNK